MKLIPLLFLIGYLSYGGDSLYYTAKYRQNYPTLHPISKEVNIDNYVCLLGVRYGYGHMIGEEVYIEYEHQKYGPYLIVDVESKLHNKMYMDNIIADINCYAFVHRNVTLKYRGNK